MNQSKSLDQWTVDNWYSLTRTISLFDEETRRILFGLCNHLLQGPDYDKLATFLAWYQEKFFTNKVINYLSMRGWKINRVLDVGSGKSSLGKSIGESFGVEVITVDKRREFEPKWVLDIENVYHRGILKDNIKENDLLVFSQLWHCIENPREILSELSFSYWAVIEPDIDDLLFGKSWKEQLELFGCNPLTKGEIIEIFNSCGKEAQVIPLGGSYILVLG